MLPLPYLFELMSLQSAPFFQQGSVTNPPQGSFPRDAIAQLAAGNLRYGLVQNRPPRNYVLQWNLNIQRQISSDLTLLVGYAGSHGVHQPFHGEDINIIQPALSSAGYVWPISGGTHYIPNAGQVTAVFWNGDSVYHALNAKLTKRLTNGLQMQAAYTWSKSLDTSSASVAGDAFTNSIFNMPFFDSRLTRAPSDFDVRQTFSSAYTWQLPKVPASFGLARPVLDDWQWNSIVQATTGLPFSVGIGGDPLGLKSAIPFDFPDRVLSAGCGTAVTPGSKHYINTQCFRFPRPSNRLGDARRNSLTGPGLISADTSLYRNLPVKSISERFTIQFRAEIFNFVNHTNLASPAPRGNRDIFNQSGGLLATAGLITNTSTTSRQVQFGLKATW